MTTPAPDLDELRAAITVVRHLARLHAVALLDYTELVDDGHELLNACNVLGVDLYDDPEDHA